MIVVRISNRDWRIDADGFLRVTARILKAGVYPYAVAEMPPELQKEFAGKSTINQRITSDEFTPEALASLEGKPVITDAHEWQEASEEPDKARLRVGNIAGKPVKDGDSAVCDLLVTHPRAIKAIQSGELVEVSAAYDSELERPEKPYEWDATQRNLRFNHILLLPEGRGRCGPEVRILNEAKPMAIELTIGDRKYRFENEKDAEEAKKLAADEKANCQNAADQAIAAKDEALKTKNAELQGHMAKLQEAMAEVERLKGLIASFSSEEAQESQATEREQLKGDVDAVVNAEPEGKEKEALKTAIGNCKTLREKAKTVAVHVLNSKGVKTEGMSDDGLTAAFRTLAATAKSTKPAVKGHMPIPQRVQNQAEIRKHPVFQRAGK